VGERPEYHLVFRATGEPVPEILRLRMLLKALLRQYGFRVTEIREVGNAFPDDERQVSIDDWA
jgi:hypothetical protein